MEGRQFKNSIFEQFAKIAHAFASSKRLEIIDVLSQCERDVESLAQEVKMTTANTSRHLQVLKNARLVENRKDGVRVIYRIADDDVINCWQSLQSLAENRLAEIKEITRIFLSERDIMEAVSREELWNRIKSEDVIVLDVRPRIEYESGHIPKAISIPLPKLKNNIEKIPKDCEIVAYCRGPYCVLAVEAVRFLRKAGYNAALLEDGYPEWKEAHLPVEKGSSKKQGFPAYKNFK